LGFDGAVARFDFWSRPGVHCRLIHIKDAESEL
jgi:hypothetical protein